MSRAERSEYLARIEAENRDLRARIEEVRRLHQRGVWTATERFYCKHCRNREVEWPCPTVKALDGIS